MSVDVETFSPPIVCLCGSTKFKQAFEEAAERETCAGRIVLSVGFFAGAMTDAERRSKLTPTLKQQLDELHLRKIDLADEVLVLNVNYYLGLSTRREVWYARQKQKVIRWFMPHETDPEVLSFFHSWDDWRAAADEAARG